MMGGTGGPWTKRFVEYMFILTLDTIFVALEHFLPVVFVWLEQFGRGDVWPGKHPMLLWGSGALSHATAASAGGGGGGARGQARSWDVSLSVACNEVDVLYIVEIGIYI